MILLRVCRRKDVGIAGAEFLAKWGANLQADRGHFCTPIDTKPVQRRLALVIPDVTAFKAPPLLAQLWRDLGRCGIDVMVGAERLFDLQSFLGACAMTRLTERDHVFTSITAVGSMGEDDADLLSARSSKAWGFGRVYPIEAGLSVFGWGWRKRPRIEAKRLERAEDDAAWMIGDGIKPRLMRIASASVVTMTQAPPGVLAPPAPLWTLPAPQRLKLAALMAQAAGRTGARESFNGKFRDECLNMEWFRSRAEAKVEIVCWRKHHNAVRPHSSLGYLTPNAFAKKYKGLLSAAADTTGRPAALHDGSAPRPVDQSFRMGQEGKAGNAEFSS